MKFKENYTQQLQRLNEYQKAAVFDESSACLVNANVGSGKTTVLITKVMYLHYEKQIPYEQMVGESKFRPFCANCINELKTLPCKHCGEYLTDKVRE